jgi:adenosylcobinamide-GDP ribazoletransferase
VSGFIDAVTFLTRVPVGRRGSVVPGDADRALAGAVPWFGVVGALVGAAAAAVYAGAHWLLPAAPAAACAVAAAVLLTGAFHEDGLADSADALWGGYERERRLEILRDSRHGTFGVAALALALVLRVTSLASLPPWTAAGALIAAGALGRGAAVVLMATAPTARSDGLGASYVRALRRRHVVAALAASLGLGVAGLGGWVVAAVPAALAGALAVRRLAMVKLGGIVGDVLGAAEQVAELAVLAAAAAVVHRSAGPIGWWPR